MISYVIPTRDRPEELAFTLRAIESLGSHDAEVIVVDNASAVPPLLPAYLADDIPVRSILLPSNIGAAARNVAARKARGEWVVMLDDDSHPLTLDHLHAVEHAPDDVAAIMADIHLPGGRRESGGLPEVFIGCGVAVRTEAFLRAGGYDPAFNYYAEEYDLAARLIHASWHITFNPRFRVMHRKVASARSRGVIIERLVRNNGWVMQRYAPEDVRRSQLGLNVRRYRAIANREGVLGSYREGLIELRRTLFSQTRSPLTSDEWDRFTGLASARLALQAEWNEEPFRTVALVDRGKNDWAIEEALRELGCTIVAPGSNEEAWVVGTLSPGPMLDALERARKGPRLLAPSTLGVYAGRGTPPT
jgi:GT2 family glycosyltransferase